MKILFIFILLLVGCSSNDCYGHNLVKQASIVEKQKLIEDSFIDSSKYTIDNPNIILNPYDYNPLSALIIFELDTPKEVILTVESKDHTIDIIHTFSASDKHFIPVYGLYADYNNHIIISIDGINYDYYIKTDPLPCDIDKVISIDRKDNFIHNEIYMMSPSYNKYLVGYDVYGDIRFYTYDDNNIYWEISRNTKGNIVYGSNRLLANPYYNTGLFEIDLLGKVYNEYVIPDGYHHDYAILTNNNYLVASNDFTNNRVEDTILEIDYTNGNVVKSFDLKDILMQDTGKSEYWTESDWFHNNSVWYDKTTNSITLSGRHQDAIINIDYTSGKLNWIIGDKYNWDISYHKYFFKPINDVDWSWAQHAAMILPNGNVFVFDNGNNRSKDPNLYLDASDNYSRGVIYDINVDDMTISQVYQYGKELGSSFFSPYISDVDYISDGHYIIHSGGQVSDNGIIQNRPAAFYDNPTLKSSSVEIINDEVVFRIDHNTNYFRTTKMPLYTDGNNYQPGLGHTLGSQSDSHYKEVIDSQIVIDDTLDDVILKYEQDRLAITHTYKETDIVDVILYQDNKQYVYGVNTKSTDLTAMCIALPNNNHEKGYNTVTKYINDTDIINGSYQIYLRINSKIYDLNTYIGV